MTVVCKKTLKMKKVALACDVGKSLMGGQIELYKYLNDKSKLQVSQ